MIHMAVTRESLGIVTSNLHTTLGLHLAIVPDMLSQVDASHSTKLCPSMLLVAVAMFAAVTSSLVVVHWPVDLVYLVAAAGAVVAVGLARPYVFVQVVAFVVHQSVCQTYHLSCRPCL